MHFSLPLPRFSASFESHYCRHYAAASWLIIATPIDGITDIFLDAAIF
jgi:hypothetical protein